MPSKKFIEVKVSSDECALVLDIDESTKVTVTKGLSGRGLGTSARSLLITTRGTKEPSTSSEADTSSEPVPSTSSADSTSDAESSEYVYKNKARVISNDEEESGTSDSAEASASDSPATSEGSNDADAEDSTTTSKEKSAEAQPVPPPFAKRKTAKANNANASPRHNLMTRIKGHGRPEWTLSHDTLIKNMKEGGETWASIATALGRSKKDVQRRFKELTADDGNPREERNEQLNTSPVEHSKPALGDSDPEVQEQLYLQEQIKENLYPPYLNLKPDDTFTKNDCQVLATVDSKMKRGRWLEMQANFYNATGQMLPLSVFRDRCEAAEAEQRARMTEEKIKAWKARLDQFKQLDPNAPSGHIAGFA